MSAPSQIDNSQTLEARAHQLRQALTDTAAAPIAMPDGAIALRRLATPIGEVFITEGFVQHLIHHHPNETREAFAHYIIPTLLRPNEVWQRLVVTKGRAALNNVYLGGYSDKRVVAVVRETPRNGWVAWTFYPVRNLGSYRKGALIYQAGNSDDDQQGPPTEEREKVLPAKGG